MGATRVRLTSLSLSLPLLAVVSLAVGCGDNTPSQNGTGGTSVTGTGGSGGGTGGTSTGGAGGTSTGGAGGQSVGGAGGTSLGGAGGTSLGGAGGTSLGGAGGTSLGGAGGTSLSGAGGTSTGGTGGGPPACYTTAFTAPASGATLTVADDSNHTCADGFQYTVTITSSAPDGTDVTLYDGSTLLKTVKVSAGAASFAVQLSTAGAQQLSIQYPSTQTCNVTENVTVTCPNSPPTCTISKPVISATHPELNGVPTAQGGDRSSSAGSAYQVTFVINTSAEDGQAVTLAVNSEATNPPTPVDGTPTANVSGGSASFGLTLVPDGTYDVTATCINKNGITGTSTKSTFTVDTLPPDLTVTSPTAGMFVVGGNVQACAQTDSPDAASLAGSLGAGQQNLCVQLGSSATPSCVAVASINTPTCVNFACPGAAPFSLTYTLTDAAGNPTTQTVTGVTCASARPTVQIIAPASDAPLFKDPTKHILAANAPVGVKDEDPNTIGAQADVVACTDTVGTATLLVGHKGDATLVQLGTAVTTAATTGQCPSGLGNVAVFSGVTLPESNEDGTGALVAATELQVSVTSAANAVDIGTSLADDVWVDSQAPNLALLSPAGLCGSFAQSATTVTEDVAYTADDALVVLDLTNNGTTTTYDVPSYVNGVATFGSVAFLQGQNSLVTTESDPAGNATVLPACTVTVGMAPVVTFTTPTAGALLCPNGSTATGCIDDSDTGTAGWQGSLTVNVKASGANVVGSVVTFTDGTTTLGMATTDANGNATFSPATVPEGVQTITATTDNVASAGVGSGSVTVTVDTIPPNAPTNLNVSITDRRKTSMQLTWTAPSDGSGGNVAGYQVRYALQPITTTNFNDNTVTTSVSYTGMPASAGQLDGIAVSPVYIENGYYFAVQATDVAGNVSGILATPSGGTCTCLGQCCAAHFLTTTLTGLATTDHLGLDVSGAGDFGTAAGLGFAKDGLSDLIVGSAASTKVYLYFGTSSGYSTTPSIAITGSVSGFGQGAIDAGDLDGDGLDDIAISSPNDGVGGKIFIFSRKNPPASWGTTTSWPATLTDTQANYTITLDATFKNTVPIRPLARLGNFDGTGSDDLAIGARTRGTGGEIIVVKGSSAFGSLMLPDSTNTIEIDAPGAAAGQFGFTTVGIGQFYTGAGPTLVTSAVNLSALYAYRGQATVPTAPDDSTVGTVGQRYGATIGFLGPLANSPGAITAEAQTGLFVDLFLGSAADGPFLGTPGGSPAPSVHFTDGAVANSFGVLNLGGGVLGTSQIVSLIGNDAVPDLVLAGQGEANSPIYVINGAQISTLAATVDVSTAAASIQASHPITRVPNVIPTPWGGYSTGAMIFDSNGDTYGDFAVGEFTATAAGRVVVFY